MVPAVTMLTQENVAVIARLGCTNPVYNTAGKCQLSLVLSSPIYSSVTAYGR